MKKYNTIATSFSGILLLVLGCCIPVHSAAKQELQVGLQIPATGETIHVHLAQRSLMPGETMWFKLYVVDGRLKQLSPVSKVAYVELIDSKGSAVWQSKISLSEGAGYGSWHVPASLASGTYLLRSYTQLQYRSGLPLHAEALMVLNPLRSFQWPLQIPVPSESDAASQVVDTIKWMGLKKTYANREAVNFKLSGLQGASLSVAVYQADSLESSLGNHASPVITYPVTGLGGHVEYAGHIIQGRVTDRRNGEPLAGRRVYLSVPGKRFHFTSSVSDETGHIRFEVNNMFGTGQVIAQPAAIADSGLTISLDNPFAQLPAALQYTTFTDVDAWKQSWDKRTAENSLRQLYARVDQEKYYLPGQEDSTAFYGQPDKRYRLDDYTRFGTLEEVLREYIPEVELKKVQGDFRFRVLNQPFRRSFDGNPLVLLDGVAVKDIDRLMQIDPLKISKLELVTRRYFLGDMAFEGIMSFSTYEGDLGGFQLGQEAIVFDYPGLQLLQQFSAPNYDKTELRSSRLPDLRSLLLWEPEAAADVTGVVPIDFYTGDLSGEFIVDIKGFNKAGEAIRLKKMIRVGGN
jgi:hypothetical protein